MTSLFASTSRIWCGLKPLTYCLDNSELTYHLQKSYRRSRLPKINGLPMLRQQEVGLNVTREYILIDADH